MSDTRRPSITSAPKASVRIISGSFGDALSHGRKLLNEHPEAALRQAVTLLRGGPEPRALRLAAAAYRQLGQAKEAEASELAAIGAGFRNEELEEAAIAAADGRAADALILAERFLHMQPDDLLAQTIAAESLMAMCELQRAEDMLRTVLSRAPTYLRASMLLAACLVKQVRVRDAIAVLDDVIARKPDNVPALIAVAENRAEVGDIEWAITHYSKIVEVEPNTPERWVMLAQYLRIAGRRDASIAAFRHALAIDHAFGSAWWGLAQYYPSELTEEDVGAIRAALSAGAPDSDLGVLQIALGILADRDGNHADAFHYYAAGKRARLARQPYDPIPMSAATDHLIGTFIPLSYQQLSQHGVSNSSPIFIIGMPRSGTTLVERILGCHSAIEATSELQIILRLAENLRHHAKDPENYAALLENLSKEQVTWIGERYLQASADYRHSDKPLFIDKNNFNWMHIGLILVALPNARIIDVRRNGLDCCWANFRMLFNQVFPAANDLRHIGRFYRDYVRLLDAMGAIAPDRILAVRYEDVVNDAEAETRRITDFLGLQFEPACLDFHLSTGAVATASSEQVRRPLNRGGIGSAESYRRWLEPLIEELGPLAEPINSDNVPA